jgi:hypothetical protein
VSQLNREKIATRISFMPDLSAIAQDGDGGRGNRTEPSNAGDAVPSRKSTLSQTTISERVRYDFHDNPADMITIP